MLFLKKTRDYLAILAIFPIRREKLPLMLQKYQEIIHGIHVICMLISLITFSLSMACMIAFEAKAFVEYTAAAFHCTVSFLDFATFVMLLWIRPKLLVLMKHSEGLIRESKIDFFSYEI